MTYGSKFNMFFKDNIELTNQEKVEQLKQYSVGDLLALLRNIEEYPRQFDEEIIRCVYSCLYDKNIMCI